MNEIRQYILELKLPADKEAAKIAIKAGKLVKSRLLRKATKDIGKQAGKSGKLTRKILIKAGKLFKKKGKQATKQIRGGIYQKLKGSRKSKDLASALIKYI